MSNDNDTYIKVFNCPKCGKKLGIDVNKNFSVGLCPNCKSRITIPKVDKK